MSQEASQNVPSGLVRSLTARWQLNGPTTDDVDSVRPRKTIPQLQNSFLHEILRHVYAEQEVTGFTVEQERQGGASQTSNITTVQVLSTKHTHVRLIFKSINSSSSKAKVRTGSSIYLTGQARLSCEVKVKVSPCFFFS
jgi:hypothetical protein